MELLFWFFKFNFFVILISKFHPCIAWHYWQPLFFYCWCIHSAFLWFCFHPGFILIWFFFVYISFFYYDFISRKICKNGDFLFLFCYVFVIVFLIVVVKFHPYKENTWTFFVECIFLLFVIKNALKIVIC